MKEYNQEEVTKILFPKITKGARDSKFKNMLNYYGIDRSKLFTKQITEKKVYKLIYNEKTVEKLKVLAKLYECDYFSAGQSRLNYLTEYSGSVNKLIDRLYEKKFF